MFFLIFGVLTLHLSWLDANAPNSTGNPWYGVACLGILLASVIVHELGHLIVSLRLGIPVDEVVIGPLGGLGPLATTPEPQCELVVSTAGPLANLGVCFVSAFCLALMADPSLSLTGLMNPLVPTAVLDGDPLIVGMKITFWINWLLILINLIPAFPFDGGRALRALLQLVNPNIDGPKAIVVVARAAKITALALLILAYFNFSKNQMAPLQTWFALALLAIFVFFSAKKEEAMATQTQIDEAVFGYDFSAGYTSLERSTPRATTTKPAPSALARWWKRRQALRAQRRRDVEVQEDGRVDELLIQVHQSGLHSLSPADRELLRRVSQRYRNRTK
ncbi:MAG: hypothetical protein KDB23_10535 [Planctomycetales bacterium]|nr:hypothetical protein [Planctomycetales bacterium]